MDLGYDFISYFMSQNCTRYYMIMAPSVGPQFLIIGEFAGAGTKICRGSWASEVLLVSHQVRFKTAIDRLVIFHVS